MSSRLNSTVEVKPEAVQLVDLGQPGKGKGPAIEYTDAEKEYFKAMKEEQERKRQVHSQEYLTDRLSASSGLTAHRSKQQKPSELQRNTRKWTGGRNRCKT